MFKKRKVFVSGILGLAFLTAVLITTGCEITDEEPVVDQVEPDEKEEITDELAEEDIIDEALEEEVNDDLVFTLPVNARNLTASPRGDYLLFTNGGTQFEPYFMINMQTYEAEFCDQRRSYWGEVEQLPAPGLEHGRAYSPQFSPGGEKLLYIAYGYEDYDEYGAGSIYLSRPDLPPEVYDQVELESEEIIRGIRPVWKADLSGIYYVTAEGVKSYCTGEGQVDEIILARDLSGLVQENRFAPYAFCVEEDLAWLAYFHEGMIKLASLEDNGEKMEVFDTGLSDIRHVEFIFGGRYLVLESAYMFDVEGHWLEFLDMQTGETVELDNDYLPLMHEKTGYMKTDHGELIVNKVERKEDSGPVLTPVLLNNKLEKVRSLDLPPEVFPLDDKWFALERTMEGTKLYKVNLE